MKKWFCVLLAMLLFVPAMAENLVLPVKMLDHTEAQILLKDALNTARAAVENLPEQTAVRAQLVEMSTGEKAWVVTIFDSENFTNGWCIMVDAGSGAVLGKETAVDGFFTEAFENWTAAKGIHALWSMEDKQLYDALYAVQPSYGLPAGDITKENALNLAMNALNLSGASIYEIGYGYLVNDDGAGGVWEITFVLNDQVVYQVNLDATTIYYMYPGDAGNG